MKKIIISTIALSSLLLASEYKYEITPMIGYVDTKEHVDLEDHKTAGVAVAINRDKDCKFDQIEIGLLQSINVDYENSLEDTDITQLFVNGIKAYSLNDKFKLYALAGLGYEYIDRNIAGNDSSALFNYGVGIKYAISDRMSLKLDARHQLKFDGDKNILYTFGLSIPFGEKALKKVEKKETIVELDSDNDGVIDSKDNCPTTPVNTKVDDSGCAIILDGDNDGVIDSKDKCLTTPVGAKVDNSGCKILNKPENLGVVFETNSAKIKSSDISKFKKYVEYLNLVPDAIIIIEAHTDSLGNAEYNLKLSQKRANSAKVLLVKMGISESRIEAKGYGESKPKVSNDTAKNRQINRRVTARIAN